MQKHCTCYIAYLRITLKTQFNKALCAFDIALFALHDVCSSEEPVGTCHHGATTSAMPPWCHCHSLVNISHTGHCNQLCPTTQHFKMTHNIPLCAPHYKTLTDQMVSDCVSKSTFGLANEIIPWPLAIAPPLLSCLMLVETVAQLLCVVQLLRGSIEGLTSG